MTAAPDLMTDLAPLPPEILDPGVDFTALRARRSRFWRPGRNTRFAPWVALAETNLGFVALDLGERVDAARERVASWHRIATGSGAFPDPALIMVGAVVVDPRGDIHDGWKLPGIGSMPDPVGSPRWAQLRRITEWTSCSSCRERRWPGCYVLAAGGGCSLCQPLRELQDPRAWPSEPDHGGPDPVVVAAETKAAKAAARRRR